MIDAANLKRIQRRIKRLVAEGKIAASPKAPATPNEGIGAALGQTAEHCSHGNSWDDHCDGCGRIIGELGMSGA